MSLAARARPDSERLFTDTTQGRREERGPGEGGPSSLVPSGAARRALGGGGSRARRGAPPAPKLIRRSASLWPSATLAAGPRAALRGLSFCTHQQGWGPSPTATARAGGSAVAREDPPRRRPPSSPGLDRRGVFTEGSFGRGPGGGAQGSPASRAPSRPVSAPRRPLGPRRPGSPVGALPRPRAAGPPAGPTRGAGPCARPSLPPHDGARRLVAAGECLAPKTILSTRGASQLDPQEPFQQRLGPRAHPRRRGAEPPAGPPAAASTEPPRARRPPEDPHTRGSADGSTYGGPPPPGYFLTLMSV